MDRIPFGVQKLDEALIGGVPKGNLVLISGGAGTGKSTLCLQFLVNGARNGLPALYISTEQKEADLIRQGNQYGWNMTELIDKNTLKIVYFDILRDASFVEKIREVIRSSKPQLLVIDSLNTLSDFANLSDYSKNLAMRGANHPIGQGVKGIIPSPLFEKALTKQLLAMFIHEIRSYDVTSLLISEIPNNSDFLSSDGISEFLADGIFVLSALCIGDTLNRTVQIRKMRYTKMYGGIMSFDLSESGISMT